MYRTLDTTVDKDQIIVDAQQRSIENLVISDRDANRFQHAHPALVDDLEELLAAARPGLMRFARRRGIVPDMVDDVVQETLIEAWRHLNYLRAPDRFEAWIRGICRNICLRWSETQGKTAYRQESLSSLLAGENDTCRSGTCSLSEMPDLDIPDPSAFDPIEVLNRQDLATLLDRALGHLPGGAREALELYYLAELPQREAALRLGLTINALEVRLHRGRRQLRQVLNGELRADAQKFGLMLDEEVDTGWRETRIWCMFCGRHHLQGILEPLLDGRVNLRMRCPGCNREWIRSGGMPELVGYKSFRPAFNRTQQVAADYWTSCSTRQKCPYCEAPIKLRLTKPNEPLPSIPPWRGLRTVMECPSCDSLNSNYIGGWTWLHPLAQQFMTEHPRWVNEPEVLVEYVGQPAIRVRLADITSAARLTCMVHRQTFEILKIFQE
jgi:RNA polymerase sigma factor (sigma-70 family)